MLRFCIHDGVLDFSEHVTMISYVGLFHCAIDFFELFFFFFIILNIKIWCS